METKELIEWLKSCAEKNCPMCPEVEECVGPSWLLKKAAEKLENLVAAEVVHGKWVELEKGTPWFCITKTVCSVCGAEAEELTDGGGMLLLSNYCPHCGSKMDK